MHKIIKAYTNKKCNLCLRSLTRGLEIRPYSVRFSRCLLIYVLFGQTTCFKTLPRVDT